MNILLILRKRSIHHNTVFFAACKANGRSDLIRINDAYYLVLVRRSRLVGINRQSKIYDYEQFIVQFNLSESKFGIIFLTKTAISICKEILAYLNVFIRYHQFRIIEDHKSLFASI
jgi:hypothetical protein